MPIVKNVLVRLRADGAAKSKADMDALALRARELAAMDPTIRLSVEDRAAMARLAALRFELRALKLAGDRAGLGRLAGELRLLGGSVEHPRAKVRALSLEMQALQAAAADAAGPGGLGKLLGGIGPGGPVAGAVIGGGVLTALTSGLGGLIPMLVAAGMGVAAFGALAYPTFSKVKTAITSLQADTLAYQNATTKAARNTALHKIQDDWKALDPAQKQAVKGVQALGAEFSKMARQMEPVVMKVLNEGLKIAGKLLPDLLPFARAAGGAILDLLKGFDKFASSPGFKAFLANMASLSGPAITTIVTGLAQITIALFKLVVSLENPNMLRAAKYFFEVIAGAITGLAWLITSSTVQLTALFHMIAVMFDKTRHAVAVAARAIAHTFDDLRHDIARWSHDAAKIFDDFRHRTAVVFDGVRHEIAHIWDMTWNNTIGRLSRGVNDANRLLGGWWHDIVHWLDNIRHDAAHIWDVIWNNTIGRIERGVKDAVTWFKGLPGKIIAALAALPGLLFKAGQHAVSMLISGLGSMLGALGNMAASLASKIAGFFGLSPAREGPLSGSGSMEIRGAHIARDLARGMTGQSGYVAGAAGMLARGMVTGGPMIPAGAGVQVVLSLAPGADQSLMRALWPLFRAEVRVRGGGGPQSVQRALGQVWR